MPHGDPQAPAPFTQDTLSRHTSLMAAEVQLVIRMKCCATYKTTKSPRIPKVFFRALRLTQFVRNPGGHEESWQVCRKETTVGAAKHFRRLQMLLYSTSRGARVNDPRLHPEQEH